MVQDLVVAATNKGLKEIDSKIKDHMKEKTGDIIPNIPGFDMGNLFKWLSQKKKSLLQF